MNRKEGIVLMTIDDFEHFTRDALREVAISTERMKDAESTFLITSVAMIAYSKLKNVIFREDNEKDTDTDTETSIF